MDVKFQSKFQKDVFYFKLASRSVVYMLLESTLVGTSTMCNLKFRGPVCSLESHDYSDSIYFRSL